MRRPIKQAFIVMFSIFAPTITNAETISFPLISDQNTNPKQVISKPVFYNGFNGLHVKVSPDHKSIEEGGCDNCTFVALEGIDFSNGTIEIEVAGKPVQNAPKWARGFVGIVFRANLEKDTYEGVYLRPLNATAETQIQRNHTVQYFSYPDYPWHVLRKETPGHYETYAPIEAGEWTKMRIDIDGEKMRLFLNNAPTPTLVVNDLKLGPDQNGTIGLFTEPATDAYFRNLIVTPRKVGFLAGN